MFLSVRDCEPMARAKSNEVIDFYQGVAHRLRLLRSALGLTQHVMGVMSGGSGSSTWSNYEKGAAEPDGRMIPALAARRICQATGCTESYIYAGVVSTLPADLAEKITFQMELERRGIEKIPRRDRKKPRTT